MPLIEHDMINFSGVWIILRNQTNLLEVKWSVTCNLVGGHDWKGAANSANCKPMSFITIIDEAGIESQLHLCYSCTHNWWIGGSPIFWIGPCE